MTEKISVDKQFLFKVLNQVDTLTKRIRELEEKLVNSSSSISEQQFADMYNKMVERNMKNIFINSSGGSNELPFNHV